MICHYRFFFSAITPLRFIAILAGAQFFNKQLHFHKNALTSSSLLLKFPRVTFKLNPRHTYNDTFNLFYRCNGRTLAITTQHASQIKNQASLFPPILQQPDLVDFSTSIQFHNGFKVIVMGDSVAVQFGEGLDESLEMAALGRKDDSNISSNRTTLKYEWGLHEAITYLGTMTSGNIMWDQTIILSRISCPLCWILVITSCYRIKRESFDFCCTYVFPVAKLTLFKTCELFSLGGTFWMICM